MELNKTPYYKGVMRIDEKLVEIWKEHTKSNSILIIFEKWIESKEYRDYICKKLDIPNYDIKNTITDFGGGSSFTGKTLPTIEELKSRSKMINLPMNINERLKESDIKERRKKLGFPEPKKIMVLGDSHSLVFKHYTGNNFSFDVNVVHGATARGSINPNTKTNSLNIFENSLKKEKADMIAVMLGEVDCGYLIWYKNKFEGKSIKSQLDDSILKLTGFLTTYVEEYYPKKEIILLGAPPPTIKDNTEKKFLKGARSSINTPIEKRTRLTIEYNRILKEVSRKQGYNYIDINNDVMEGYEVKNQYLSEDPFDHHLNSETTINIWVDKLNELLL
jgi:lysophospholipase L1-like esterase